MGNYYFIYHYLTYPLYLFIATSDFVALNDSLTLSDDVLIQCVPIDIVSDSVAESDQECFSFSLSTGTIGGLTLSPSEAQICISDEEGKHYVID